MSELRRAYVYVQDQYAGIISETDEGYTFAYDDTYLSSEHALAVSITLPLRKQPYTSNTLFAFFDGLIPEGWLLDVVSKNWKISQKDRFGLLLVTGKDCIGDVSVREN